MKKLTFLLILIALEGCAKKSLNFCGSPELMDKPSIESKVISLQRVGIADTTIAFIDGLVLGKDSADNKIKIDTLPSTFILFINRETSDSISLNADLHGKFQRDLTAGTYDILFSMIGYNQLRVENVSFGTGELKELNVLLGYGSKETYKVNGQNFNLKDK